MEISAIMRRSFENTKMSCWKMIDRYYKTDDADRYEVADMVLIENIRNNDIIIEAGCGHRPLKYKEAHFKSQQFYLIGIDLLKEDMLANNAIDAGVVADLRQMPFKENSVDKIVSRMVIEHLEDPESFFREVSSILKPQGEFIILTPNKYGLVTLAARLIPNSHRPRILKRLTGESSSDVFPTYYRANTIHHLDKLAKKSGMRRDVYVACQPPPFAFVFSRLACLASILYFRLISRYECFAFLRGAIVARYVKGAHES